MKTNLKVAQLNTYFVPINEMFEIYTIRSFTTMIQFTKSSNI